MSATKREAAGMRINTPETEAMVLSQKRMDFLLWVGNELLSQVEEFKYPGNRGGEIDRQTEAKDVCIEKKGSWAEWQKLSLYQLICIPAVTCGHHLRVVTERMKRQTQADEMRSFWRVYKLIFRYRSGRGSEQSRFLGEVFLDMSNGKRPWSRESWRKRLSGRRSGDLCSYCCPCDPVQGKKKKMDGWSVK